jgi:hypothetical protein
MIIGLKSRGEDCTPRHRCRTWKEERFKMELELRDTVARDGSEAPAFSVIQIIQILPMTCHKDEATTDTVGPSLSSRYSFLRPSKIPFPRHDPPKSILSRVRLSFHCRPRPMSSDGVSTPRVGKRDKVKIPFLVFVVAFSAGSDREYQYESIAYRKDGRRAAGICRNDAGGELSEALA